MKKIFFLLIICSMGFIPITDEKSVVNTTNSNFRDLEANLGQHIQSRRITSTGGMYPKKVAALPTSGYEEGSFIYNTTTHKMYVSSNTVDNSNDWSPLN